ncbi:3-hydroxyisobutyrate dehydrogenase-like beta-hydroxyacid dehydrogenase [Methylopila capsulata]|uniref:Dehydrogenase n=1 Tax=Methylopila capsulata TaxID=61654 RepID=A0A9W6IPK9_9HYPH|nr:NAD(P)-dependent oxidoreductase [Methylopila capsulata]MBM7851048.1 3-hydroxyisobutyrate dehydrogenase-like beta-hydroxyacid dehydrogenase [Methylopila capsulata]GLK54106.1 dehydrogenase [Methylopila capsulata]
MQVAFLGLGTMGAPMAANLAKAGVALRVWNRSEGPAARLAEVGAEPAASPAEAAHGADVLIAMLADDAATKAVLLDGGALEALAPGALLVNMATVAVAFGASLADQAERCGVAYVAAPVLGRVNVAEAGELNILAGGRADAIDRAQPLFDVMGRKTWRFGERPEQANAVKLAVNFMLASAIETMGEAASLAEGHGVSGADFLAMATSTVFAAPAYQGYGAAIASGTFEPAGFKLSLGLKDVRLALEAAEAARTPMLFAAVLRDNLIDGVAHGEGDLDWAALAKVAARRAGRL